MTALILLYTDTLISSSKNGGVLEHIIKKEKRPNTDLQICGFRREDSPAQKKMPTQVQP